MLVQQTAYLSLFICRILQELLIKILWNLEERCNVGKRKDHLFLKLRSFFIKKKL